MHSSWIHERYAKTKEECKTIKIKQYAYEIRYSQRKGRKFASRWYSVMGPRQWNKVKNCVRIEAFKIKLKKLLFNRPKF